MWKKNNILAEFGESINGNISFDDDSKVSMKVKENILIRFKDERHQFFSHVYYISNMKTNTLFWGHFKKEL